MTFSIVPLVFVKTVMDKACFVACPTEISKKSYILGDVLQGGVKIPTGGK